MLGVLNPVGEMFFLCFCWGGRGSYVLNGCTPSQRQCGERGQYRGGGGDPMSHVDFKKWHCPLSFDLSCHVSPYRCPNVNHVA